MLPAVCLAVALTGCAKNEPPPQTPLVPPSLLVGCDPPQNLPDRDLTAVEVEVLWGRDRTALRQCASRQGGLAGLVTSP